MAEPRNQTERKSMCKFFKTSKPKKHSCYNCVFLCAQFNYSHEPCSLHLVPDLKRHLLEGRYPDGKVPLEGCAANVTKRRMEKYKKFCEAGKPTASSCLGSLACYKSVWDSSNTVDLDDPVMKIKKIITQNRKRKCFFYKNTSTLFWPAAEELEKRKKEWDHVKLPVRISFWAIVISSVLIIVQYITHFVGCMPNPTIGIIGNEDKPVICKIAPMEHCNTPPNSPLPLQSNQDTCSTSKPTKK